MKRIVLCVIIFSSSLFGIGARPFGMGGAYVAVADDVNSIFYNPAGLATIKGGEASSLRVLNNRDSIDFKESIALSCGIKEGGIGGSYLRTLNVDWENGYADVNHNGRKDGDEPYLGSDDKIAIFAIGGYGEGLLKKTAFGVSVKRFSELLMKSYGEGKGFSEISSEKKGFGFDIGVLHHISKSISLGFAIYNINEPKFVYEGLNINNQSYDYKITHKLTLVSGISLKPDDKTIVAIDLYDFDNINDWYSKDENDRDQSSVRLGFERNVLPNLAIRGGYGAEFHSAGFGIKIKNMRFDYGLMERKGLGFHIISLTLAQ